MSMKSVEYDTVCKCKNPIIVDRGYTSGRHKIRVYYCLGCRHQFKSKSKKWVKFIVDDISEITVPSDGTQVKKVKD